MASRAAMEAYLKQSGAQLWIEHDPATFIVSRKLRLHSIVPDLLTKDGKRWR